jgi:molecular chaperone HtpG
MKIPSRLAASIRQNQELEAEVLSAVSQASKWLQEQPEFFPEYTDHSLTHFEGVLATADGLIPDHCFEDQHTRHAAFTPGDAAALVLSVLLHDLGMHITQDGFKWLVDASVNAGESVPIVHYIDHQLWPDLWNEYLAEVGRWDSRKRLEVLGDTRPLILPDNELGSTLGHRMLIGEFVRRYHPRLAHEVAVEGLPGVNGRLRLFPAKQATLDLVGLIARSHGLPIRDCIDYLRSGRFHLRTFRDIHAPYVMAILRISDYLQIQGERAPNSRLEIRSLRSPISQREWAVHKSIRNISIEEDDPEAIYVDAEPPNASIFLRIKQLLADMQQELDTSWAVLGETYGRHERLKELQIAFRRVRSNLDDVTRFGKTVSYIPVQASFEPAGVKLLQLLVEPLYQQDISMGIRELIQNAADACRERADLMARGSGTTSKTEGPEIEVQLEGDDTGGWVLSVADRGVGMSPETIINYFLRVGASFRHSDKWRSQHSDSSGVHVSRAGHFGIGVLAAFLLGPKLEVETQHMDTQRCPGIAFTAQLEDGVIDLRKKTISIGTRIRIRLYPGVTAAIQALIDDSSRPDPQWGAFPSGLYVTATPTLSILANGKQVVNLNRWPGDMSALPPRWRRIKATGFRDVHWSYLDNVQGKIAANGLAIPKGEKACDRVKWDGGRSIAPPCISVYDGESITPLSLDRREITSRLPFSDSIKRDVAHDIMAAVLSAPELGIVEDGRVSRPTPYFLGYPPASAWHPVPPLFIFRKEHYSVLQASLLGSNQFDVFHVFADPVFEWRCLLQELEADQSMIISPLAFSDGPTFSQPPETLGYQLQDQSRQYSVDYIYGAYGATRLRKLVNIKSLTEAWDQQILAGQQLGADGNDGRGARCVTMIGGQAIVAESAADYFIGAGSHEMSTWSEGDYKCYFPNSRPNLTQAAVRTMQNFMRTMGKRPAPVFIVGYRSQVNRVHDGEVYFKDFVEQFCNGRLWVPYRLEDRLAELGPAFEELERFMPWHRIRPLS